MVFMERPSTGDQPRKLPPCLSPPYCRRFSSSEGIQIRERRADVAINSTHYLYPQTSDAGSIAPALHSQDRVLLCLGLLGEARATSGTSHWWCWTGTRKAQGRLVGATIYLTVVCSRLCFGTGLEIGEIEGYWPNLLGAGAYSSIWAQENLACKMGNNTIVFGTA